MKKILLLIMVTCFLLCSVANAGVRLRGKGIYDVHKNISFVNGPAEQILDNKLKITALFPITGHTYSGELGIKPDNPNSDVYYFRVSGIGHADNVFGVKGVSLKLENLTDNVLVIHWKDSVIQMGNTSGMPFLPGMKFIDAGKPAETPNTVIPPRTFVTTDLYPAAKVKYSNSWGWNILVEPISITGTSQFLVAMKVEENGASKYYSFKTPCMNFPAAFLAQYKYDK